ncbi:MAG: substrate-binding domain-containing protein [Mycoplasma sp.]
MKRRWKKLIYGSIGIVPVLALVCFSIPFNQQISISCVGSSGVKPFVESLSKDFDAKNQGYDVTVDAGGSGFGISQVAKGFTKIGNASKDPFHDVKDEFTSEWKERKIKTVTIGWEGICLLFIPPQGLSQDGLNKLNSSLSVNQQTMINLYRVFSGYKDGLTNNSFLNLGGFISSSSTLSISDQKLYQNTKIIPYARSGGNLTSGTASSFYAGSHFKNNDQPIINQLTPRQQKAFTHGVYGDEISVKDTDEANSRAWDRFINDKEPGSVVYLSSGFVNQNIKLIEKSHVGLFQYNTTSFDVSKIKEQNGYNFYRPLNVMLSIEDKDAVKFVNYLINEVSVDTWKSYGGKHISDQDKQSMSLNNDVQNFWTSDDSSLIVDWSNPDHNYLGAKDNG